MGVGDSVTLLGRSKNEAMRQHNFNVVGIFDLHTPDAEKGTVFIPLADAQTLYNLRDQVTEVPIFLKQIGSEAAVMTALQTQLPAYEIDSWQTLKGDLKETLDAKFAYTSFFGIVVIVIASIGILNLMLMAVFERTREMGVLAALGMKGRQIMGLFLLEGSFIGVVGAVIGSALGLLLIALMGSAGLDFSKMTTGMGEVGVLMSGKIYPTITAVDLFTPRDHRGDHRGDCVAVSRVAGFAQRAVAGAASCMRSVGARHSPLSYRRANRPLVRMPRPYI